MIFGHCKFFLKYQKKYFLEKCYSFLSLGLKVLFIKLGVKSSVLVFWENIKTKIIFQVWIYKENLSLEILEKFFKAGATKFNLPKYKKNLFFLEKYKSFIRVDFFKIIF